MRRSETACKDCSLIRSVIFLAGDSHGRVTKHYRNSLMDCLLSDCTAVASSAVGVQGDDCSLVGHWYELAKNKSPGKAVFDPLQTVHGGVWLVHLGRMVWLVHLGRMVWLVHLAEWYGWSIWAEWYGRQVQVEQLACSAG